MRLINTLNDTNDEFPKIANQYKESNSQRKSMDTTTQIAIYGER